MENNRFLRQFNWRFLLVRILVNSMALVFTTAILPKIYFVDKTITSLLLMAFMLGVLNAVLKPLLQFLTLQFIFVTYGLVIVLVNALLLWLLAWLFPDRFAAESLLWLLVGGLVLGLSSSFLESLLGLTMPIVPDEPAALRRQLEEQALDAGWLTVDNSGFIPEEHALSKVPHDQNTNTAELSVLKPDEQPSQSEKAETESPANANRPVAEANNADDSITAPQSWEEETGGLS